MLWCWPDGRQRRPRLAPPDPPDSPETLLERFGLEDAALRAVAEIVHDIDLKDRKFRREEAPGIDRLIAGICMAHPTDEERLRRGSEVFGDLAEYFRRKRG